MPSPSHIPSPTGLSPSLRPLSSGLRLEMVRSREHRTARPTCPPTPCVLKVRPFTHTEFGLLPFRSPLLGESLLLSSPRATKMFQFARLPPHKWCCSFSCSGFPHSGASGSTLACSSPERFAARRALLRPSAPRHPPYALPSFFDASVPSMHLSMYSLPKNRVPATDLKGFSPLERR